MSPILIVLIVVAVATCAALSVVADFRQYEKGRAERIEFLRALQILHEIEKSRVAEREE